MRSRLAFILRQTKESLFITVSLTGGLFAGRITNEKLIKISTFLWGYLFSKYKPIVHAETKTAVVIGERKQGLPTYSITEVEKHTTKDKGIRTHVSFLNKSKQMFDSRHAFVNWYYLNVSEYFY